MQMAQNFIVATKRAHGLKNVEMLGTSVAPSSRYISNQIFTKLADNQNKHNILKEPANHIRVADPDS